MSDVVYELATRFTADTSPLFSRMNSLQPQLVGRMGAMGGAAGTAFSSAFVGATAGIAALAGGLAGGALLAKWSVGLASDAQEAGSKFAVVFGTAANKTTTVLDQFAATAGRSKYELREMSANMGALIGPLGLGADKTSEMSSRLTVLASDLASFFNSSDKEAMQSLMSGLMGEAEPMKKFGVLINENKIQAEALAMGLIKTKNEMTPLVKVQATYSLILRETKLAHGDAINTSTGYANSLRGLQGAVKDTGTMLGNLFLPAATEVIRFLRGGVLTLQQNEETWKRWGLTIGEITGNVLSHVSTATAKITTWLNSGLNEGVKTMTGGLATSFTDFVDKALNAMAILTTDLSKTWETMKAGGSFVFYSMLTSGLQAFQQLRAAAEGHFGGMGRVFSAGLDAIRSGLETFGIDVAGIFAGIGTAIDLLIDHATNRFMAFSTLAGVALGGAASAVVKSGEKSGGKSLGERVESSYRSGRESITGKKENVAQAEQSKSLLGNIVGNYVAGFKDSYNSSMKRQDFLSSAITGSINARQEAYGSMVSGVAGMMNDRAAKNAPPPAGPVLGKFQIPNFSQMATDATTGIFGKIGAGIASFGGAAGGLLAEGAKATGDALAVGENKKEGGGGIEFVGVADAWKKVQASLNGGKAEDKIARNSDTTVTLLGTIAEALSGGVKLASKIQVGFDA